MSGTSLSLCVTGAAGLLAVAALVGVLVSQVRRDALPRNGLVGIRTRRTKASDEAWRVGHRAALPLLRWVVAAAVTLAVLLPVSTIVVAHLAPAAVDRVTADGAQAAFGVVVVLLLVAARTADRAAREVLDRSP